MPGNWAFRYDAIKYRLHRSMHGLKEEIFHHPNDPHFVALKYHGFANRIYHTHDLGCSLINNNIAIGLLTGDVVSSRNNLHPHRLKQVITTTDTFKEDDFIFILAWPR